MHHSRQDKDDICAYFGYQKETTNTAEKTKRKTKTMNCLLNMQHSTNQPTIHSSVADLLIGMVNFCTNANTMPSGDDWKRATTWFLGSGNYNQTTIEFLI